MKKNKQVSAKSQYLKKKKEMPSGVDDLATHEENDIHSFNQLKQQQNPKFQQIAIKEGDTSSSEDDGELKNRDDPDEQSRFVLGLIQKNVRRVNEKNSFEIPMINIKDLNAFKQIEQGDAWKQISASLDAGSKIYGFRVDLVHQNTFKVLGGLHRTQINEKQNQEEQQEYEQEQLRKKKLQNTGGENTLEKNQANIDTNKYDLEFEIDPLFQQTSAKFDEAGAKGLLMNNLTINENLMLALDSDVLPIKPITCSLNIEKYKSFLKNLQNLKLCPELTEFRENMFQKGQNIIEIKQNISFANVMDPIALNMDFNQEDQVYENMNMAEEVMDEQASILSVNQQYQNGMVNQYSGHKFSQNKFNILNFEQAAANIGTGKVFENEKEQVAWMALDMNQQPKKKNIAQLNEKPKKNKTKKKNGLPFSFDPEEDDQDLDRQNILQKRDKENYCNNKETMNQLYLLPKSYQIDRQDLCQPFQVPKLPKWEEENQEQPFLQHDNFDTGGIDEDPQPLITQQNTAFNSAYKNTNNAQGKLNIPIKELKTQVWQNLQQQIPLSTDNAGLEFNEINKILPKILKIPQSKGRVSIQTCFVTMLHLANEQGLKFIQSDTENDFVIQREILPQQS
ncbi:unnamed protein product (macronuclear) [Paramecium tetraurelia]|uniref:Condensin complex subunit 2 n=1 Tax=Paramecium tetraurelia TaxID=5888 RepID=A0CU10_PARTE|nr:uncharacterized protein GSPATT00010476001 [Paramecium tetraurelia]CAK74277.1 unnamed protein product [Paramecium tetraurelia]|eukprot:XP_001441674.1 hypothetical protein (macronuclear) [Paramecium tetraurelia strain d4-2]